MDLSRPMPQAPTRPNASNLNFLGGQTVPNLVTVPVGNDGKVTLLTAPDGSSQLIADVTGYYVTGTPSTPGSFQSLAPSRILDTRGGAAYRWGRIQRCPSRSQGPAASLPGRQPWSSTSPWPRPCPRLHHRLSLRRARPYRFQPELPHGSDRAEPGHRPGRGSGKVTLFNRSDGATHLVADVTGYYLPGNPTASGAFKAIGPVRALDTGIRHHLLRRTQLFPSGSPVPTEFPQAFPPSSSI